MTTPISSNHEDGPMVYDPERERRNDAAYAEHKQALARGEKRVLRTTATGELHSYAGDEIGFTPGRGQAQVSSWWGMGIVTAVLALLFAFSTVMLLTPVVQGRQPYWGALLLIALTGLGAWYAFGLARDEYRATRLRKARSAPKPGTSGHLPSEYSE
jgi:hypothetical protein